MKNAVLWDITPCGSCNDRRFGGTYHLNYQDDKNRRARNNVSSKKQPKHADTLMMEAIRSSETSVLKRATWRQIPDELSVLRLLVITNVVPSSGILVTLMMETMHSSETSVLTRATRRHIPDDGILHRVVSVYITQSHAV
jgi:hypothetical protein